MKGTHYVTTPPIGGIGIEAMRFLTYHLGCPIVHQTKIATKGNSIYVIELKYVPNTSKSGKGFKFLEDAVNVETEKAALTSLEKTWRAKLACAAIENSARARWMVTAAHEVSTPGNNISILPTAQLQFEGGHDTRTAESRLTELKSRLVQAKARSSAHKPDEPSRAATPPPVLLPIVRIPRRKAVDFFDDIAPKRIPSPELPVPDEGDYWGKLNYEKRKEKVDFGAIDMFLGMVLEV